MFLALRVRHPAAPPARQRSLPGRATCPALKPRQAAEHPLSPGSLLYVLYVLSRKPHCRASAGPHSIAPRVFFSPFTPAVNPGVGAGLLTQSWRGHRIAPSILVWAQDCHTQSWRGHRIAPLNPGVGTRLPRCFPENAGSAVLYSTTPPDSPPGLRGKHRQCVGTHRRTPGLAARFPASNSGSKGKRVNGENQAVSCARIQQQTILGPRGAPGPVYGHLPRPQQVRQNRGSDQPDSGAVQGRV